MSQVRHIVPRRWPAAQGALCGAPLFTPQGDKQCGSSVGLMLVEPDWEVCAACLVRADQLQEDGDLTVEQDGDRQVWRYDDRPAEYRSPDAFADYLRENGEATYTPDDLQALLDYTKRPEAEIRRQLGRRGIRPAPQPREVRGVNSHGRTGAWRVH